MSGPDLSFARIPLAHRGLHDAASGVIENSPGAFRAAVAAGYGLELDVQLSADGAAMVFHDYDLDRLTGANGPVRAKTAAELETILLKPAAECIPTLASVLSVVQGAAPVLIELKDQSAGAGQHGVGPLEAAVAAALGDYAGHVAVMSYNPFSMAAMQRHSPEVARGLVTSTFDTGRWTDISAAKRARLRGIADYQPVGATFLSHNVSDLPNDHVARLRAMGALVIGWTARSPNAEQKARKYCDNITFEQYRPAIPDG